MGNLVPQAPKQKKNMGDKEGIENRIFPGSVWSSQDGLSTQRPPLSAVRCSTVHTKAGLTERGRDPGCG
eukprot:gene15324-biopygen21704